MISRLIISIREIWHSLNSKNSFVRNFSFVAGGKLAVAVSSFVFIPILSRLYAPEAYGNFALYNSIVSIIVTIGLLGYPNSYVLIRDNEDFFSLLVFQIWKVFILFILFLVLILVVIIIDLDGHSIIYFIPFGFLVNGLITILSNWNVRSGDFKLTSQLEGFGGIGVRISNTIIGWLGNGYTQGIIFGNIIGKATISIINLYRLGHYSRSYGFSIRLNWSRAISVMKAWSNYPKYILPNRLLAQFSGQVPIYLLAIVFNKEALGFYSMAFTVFSLPVQLFSNAVSPVYLKKASDLYSKNLESLRKFTAKLLHLANLFMILPFTLGIVFSEEIITIILGSKWAPTGFIVAFMAFPVFLELTLIPVSSILQVMKREKVMFGINIASFFLMTSVTLLVVYFEVEFNITVVIILIVRMITNWIKSYYVFRIINLSPWKFGLFYLLVLGILTSSLHYLIISF